MTTPTLVERIEFLVNGGGMPLYARVDLNSILADVRELQEAAKPFNVYDVNARFNYVVDGHKGVSVDEYRRLA